MAFKKIAVAGASGSLGPTLIEKLVAANFDVIILSRSKSSSTTSNPKTVHVDYSSHDSIVSALRGQDAVVSLIPDHGSQPAVIDAAIAAGIKRFIPSEYGSNIYGSAKTAGLPVFKGKVATQQHLKEKAGQIEWTLVMNSLFLDFGLEYGLGINIKGEAPTTSVYDGGNTPISVTRIGAVADAVVGVLRNPEATRDRAVYVQEAVVTQNQLIAYAEKRKPGLKVKREHTTIEKVEEEAYAKLKSGNKELIKPAMIDFIVVSLFNPACGALWADKNDNELLGVKPISEAEVEDEVAKYL